MVIKFVKSMPMHEQVGFIRLIQATLLDTCEKLLNPIKTNRTCMKMMGNLT